MNLLDHRHQKKVFVEVSIHVQIVTLCYVLLVITYSSVLPLWLWKANG